MTNLTDGELLLMNFMTRRQETPSSSGPAIFEDLAEETIGKISVYKPSFSYLYVPIIETKESF